MPLVYACICPLGNAAAASRTAVALARIAEELPAFDVETTLLVTSEGGQHEAIGVLTAPRAAEREVDVELSRDALTQTATAGMRTTELRRWEGPLPNPIEAGLRLVVVTTSWLEPRAHFEFGRVLGRAIEEHGQRIAVVCTAALARGTDPAAAVFDKQYRRAIDAWDVKWLAGLDREFRRRAGENAVAQSAVLMGALSRYRIQPRVLSYETSSGGGQLVATIDVLGRRKRERAEAKAAGRGSGKVDEPRPKG